MLATTKSIGSARETCPVQPHVIKLRLANRELHQFQVLFRSYRVRHQPKDQIFVIYCDRICDVLIAKLLLYFLTLTEC